MRRKARTAISPGSISPASINKDLADVLGNFVNRVTKFCVARFDGKVPGEGEYGEEEKALIAELDRRIAQYTELLESAEFRKALGELRAIWVAGNEYMTRAAPWTHIKTDRAGGGGRAHGAEPGPSVRASGLAGDAGFRHAPSMKPSSRWQAAGASFPWPDEPMARNPGRAGRRASRSRRRTCWSPRSPTSRSRNGSCAFGGAETSENLARLGGTDASSRRGQALPAAGSAPCSPSCRLPRTQ